MTFSYIFPQIRTFYLKNCTVGQPLKLWKKCIFEIAPVSVQITLCKLFLHFRKFKVWAWKCNKLDISIFLSSKVMIFKKYSNLSLKSQIFHNEAYELDFFLFLASNFYNEIFLWPFYTIFDQNIFKIKIRLIFLNIFKKS